MSEITHVVLVSWKPGQAVTAEQSVAPAIRAFAESIPGIVKIVEDRSTSPEGLEDGLDYGFVITFETPDARDDYLVDPTHRVVADMIKDHAERVVVFDL